MMEEIVKNLLRSDEPSVRYRISTSILGMSTNSAKMLALQEEIRNSPRIKAILSIVDVDGRFPRHPYQKWKGPFYTFLVLADLGYPPGDQTLSARRDQILEWLLDPKALRNVPLINGRYRRCGSIYSGAVFSLLRLGLADSRVEELVELLLKWQWPDGGWNCDIKPQATHSSFHESLIPLRGLNAWWLATRDNRVKEAYERTAEFFLQRRLLYRQTTGVLVSPEFTKLAYPAYWHYGLLRALQVMDESGFLLDHRCKDALDLLESKCLPGGGFPVEVKFYKVTNEMEPNSSPVDWGPVVKARMNEFVTAEALSILKHAGRY